MNDLIVMGVGKVGTVVRVVRVVRVLGVLGVLRVLRVLGVFTVLRVKRVVGYREQDAGDRCAHTNAFSVFYLTMAPVVRWFHQPTHSSHLSGSITPDRLSSSRINTHTGKH